MRTTLCLASIILAAIGGCQKPRQPSGDGTPILAHVGDSVITAKDLEARIAFLGQSKYLFDHYSKPEKRKELLSSLIESEVLYQEARRLGFDRNPAIKREIVNRMLQDGIDKQAKLETIGDAEIEKYYQTHSAEFSKPDQVRVSQIVVKDKAKALKVAAQVKALPKGNNEALRSLVAQVSEDQATRARGGDVGLFDRTATTLPKPVVEAAFALGQVFDVSTPIQTEGGYTIVVLTQKQPGFSKSLAEARPSIQTRLLYDLKRQKRSELTAEIHKRAKIQIDETQLAAVKLPLAGPQSSTGTALDNRGPAPTAPPSSAPTPPGR